MYYFGCSSWTTEISATKNKLLLAGFSGCCTRGFVIGRLFASQHGWLTLSTTVCVLNYSFDHWTICSFCSSWKALSTRSAYCLYMYKVKDLMKISFPFPDSFFIVILGFVADHYSFQHLSSSFPFSVTLFSGSRSLISTV